MMESSMMEGRLEEVRSGGTGLAKERADTL
jgi:hypothetical protein